MQVIKAVNDSNKTQEDEEEAQPTKLVEVLPTPQRFSSNSGFKGYGLPAYNGPDYFRPQRGNGAADYSANSAGFVVSDLRSEASSNRDYDMPSSSSRSNQYNRSPVGYRSHEKRSRSDYSPQESSSSDLNSELNSYLKAAASEASHTEQTAPQSTGSNNFAAAQSRPVARRKPTTYASEKNYDEQPQSYNFDPSMSKHFLKTQFKDSDLSNSGYMDAGNGEQIGASSNDNELAQLAATMSEFQSSNPTSSPDMFSFGNGGAPDFGGVDPHSYGGLGNLGAASMNSPHLPAASNVPGMGGFGSYGQQGSPGSASGLGVPAGAIVGAPGSAPPPGMKLAGYVTMAGPQAGGGMQGMGGMGGMPMMQQHNPMQHNMMRNPMMSPSMSRYPGVMPPPGMMGPGGPMGMQGMGGPGHGGPGGPGGMGPGGLSPALQQLIGSTFGGQMPKGLQGLQGSGGPSSSSSSNNQGSQTSASQTAPQRSRFLSRLNPMNLFRRLRSRNQSKDAMPDINNLKSLESMMASESKRKSFFVKRSGEIEDRNETIIPAENNPFGMYRRTMGRPPMRFDNERPRFQSRRGRRLSSRGGYIEGSESRPVGLMGSGNFEVIRGGFFPGNGQGGDGGAAASSNQGSGTELEDDSGNVFSSLEDDFFSAGPGIIGFQGFNSFAGASIYNSLAPSNQQKVAILPFPEDTTSKPVPEVSSVSSTSSTVAPA